LFPCISKLNFIRFVTCRAGMPTVGLFKILKLLKTHFESFSECFHMNLTEGSQYFRLMKRLKISMSLSISHTAICADLGSDIKFLILALQTTFNVQYFFFVVLVLVINSLPYKTAMMIIIIKNTRKSFTFTV
jgi:hypothetical protein